MSKFTMFFSSVYNDTTDLQDCPDHWRMWRRTSLWWQRHCSSSLLTLSSLSEPSCLFSGTSCPWNHHSWLALKYIFWSYFDATFLIINTLEFHFEVLPQVQHLSILILIIISDKLGYGLPALIDPGAPLLLLLLRLPHVLDELHQLISDPVLGIIGCSFLKESQSSGGHVVTNWNDNSKSINWDDDDVYMFASDEGTFQTPEQRWWSWRWGGTRDQEHPASQSLCR